MFSLWRGYDEDVPPSAGKRKEPDMENLSKEYLLLFNTLTEVERLLRELRERVIRAQQAAEELYISGGQPEAGNP